MNDQNKDKVKDHSYDGIEEYDNNLPNWWLVTFFLTVIFALFYWSKFYVFTKKDPQSVEYSKALEAYQKLHPAVSENVDDEKIMAMLSDSSALNRAQETFNNYCTPCHGSNAEGGIGPNLTDNIWIHGYTPKDIVQVINQGVAEKGMTSWKGILPNSKIHELAAYIISLEGSNPPKAKDPQGDIIKDSKKI